MNDPTSSSDPAAAIDPNPLAAVKVALDGVDASAQRVSTSLTSAFANAIVSGKSFQQVLQSLGTQLESMLLKSALQPIGQGLSSLVGGAISGLTGSVTPFADGGVVSGPTMFGMGSGLGLMGEAGAEAIMPLARGPDGRLGVASHGATAGATTVNVQ
ncbi:MAG: phage tail tape measure protein, partial [Hyphomicrobiales bacterium]|nr:phage tail tape measure protein [Hyphomicrobiales bacterium]